MSIPENGAQGSAGVAQGICEVHLLAASTTYSSAVGIFGVCFLDMLIDPRFLNSHSLANLSGLAFLLYAYKEHNFHPKNIRVQNKSLLLRSLAQHPVPWGRLQAKGRDKSA